MNVLGVLFNLKLNWQQHVQMALQNKKGPSGNQNNPFNYDQNRTTLLNIAKSNFFRILYYNAKIWLLPSLSSQIKKQLISASAAPSKSKYVTLVMIKLFLSKVSMPL